MISIRIERLADVVAREALLDIAYGPARLTKPSQGLREGCPPALSFVAVEAGRVIGTVRLWPVAAGGRPALLLGPLAVHPDWRCRGVGAALVRRALRAAVEAGHGAVLLVGDAAYYGRFGFTAAKTGTLAMPGAYEPARLLALELVSDALDGAHGLLRAGTPRRALRRAATAPGVAHAA